MSTKIQLWFETIVNPELKEKVSQIGELARLCCNVKFKTPSGWYDTLIGIIDTGAPISVIPFDIWTEIKVQPLVEFEIHGINPRKECSLPAMIGKTKCILLDEKGNCSRELEVFSYLALTNLVPLIIGFKDILEHFAVHFDYGKKIAFIEA